MLVGVLLDTFFTVVQCFTNRGAYRERMRPYRIDIRSDRPRISDRPSKNPARIIDQSIGYLPLLEISADPS